MSDGPGFLASEGVSEAADAFQAAMDSETPGRSSTKRTDEEKPRQARQQMEDLFPRREMNRDEEEGGADEPPPRREDEDEDEEQDERADEREEDDEEESAEREEEEGEEEQQQPGDLDLNQPIRSTIDGEEVELPLGEAIRSGLREKTFHKYMTQLDMAVRETNQQRQNLSEQYQAHVQKVQELEAFLTELLPTPDWPALFRQNPTHAMTMKVEWDAIEEKRTKVRDYLNTIRENESREQMRQLHNFANANRSQLAAAHPEWKDEKVWKRDHDSMRRTALAVGYSDAEINSLYDARGGQILWMASKYARMMAAPPKPVKQGFTSGKKSRPATPSRNVARALDRNERRISRGTAKDKLASAFERILDSEG